MKTLQPNGQGERKQPTWAPKMKGERHPRAPIPITHGGLVRPPRLASMGTQNVPKTTRGTHPPGTHSPHPHGALIGLREWRQWGPESRPKRRAKCAPRAPDKR